MDEREEVLSDLVHLRRSLTELNRSLHKFPWDGEKPMLIIKKTELSRILRKCLDGSISFQELETWANAISQRDDLGFETDEMLDIIFQLANPDINGALSNEKLLEFIRKLD